GATGVGKQRQQNQLDRYRSRSRSSPLQDLRIGAIPHEARQLPPLRADAAAEGGVPDSAAGAAGPAGRRPAVVRKMAQPGYGGEYRPEDPPVARVPRHDAEPTAGALARLPFVSLAD